MGDQFLRLVRGTCIVLHSAGPYSVLERLVKPVRAKVNRKAHRERWWQYGDKRPALYERLDQSEFAVAIVIHSGLLRPAVVPKGVVFSHALAVFPANGYELAGLLLSSAHRIWAIARGSSLGKAHRYTPSDCFDTFPFPSIPGLWRSLYLGCLRCVPM